MTDTRHTSLSKRIKAVKNAWLREQQLVKEGKGTRDWTPQQQKDILERGKAYDDEGFAFEGQHMKSAEQYPQYQEDAGNIQFLTRSEHLEAHKGKWQTQTNWYYDPVAKKIIDFGENPYKSCEIIQLSMPEYKISSNLEKIKKNKTYKIDHHYYKSKHFQTKYINNKLQAGVSKTLAFIKKRPFVGAITLASAMIITRNFKGKKYNKLYRIDSILNEKEDIFLNRIYTPNFVPVGK